MESLLWLFRLVETISIKSYDHKNQSEAQILKPPNVEVISDGSGVVIIDDLVDSGKTMQLVRDNYPKAHFASIYAKPIGRDIVDSTRGTLYLITSLGEQFHEFLALHANFLGDSVDANTHRAGSKMNCCFVTGYLQKFERNNLTWLLLGRFLRI